MWVRVLAELVDNKVLVDQTVQGDRMLAFPERQILAVSTRTRGDHLAGGKYQKQIEELYGVEFAQNFATNPAASIDVEFQGKIHCYVVHPDDYEKVVSLLGQ